MLTAEPCKNVDNLSNPPSISSSISLPLLLLQYPAIKSMSSSLLKSPDIPFTICSLTHISFKRFMLINSSSSFVYTVSVFTFISLLSLYPILMYYATSLHFSNSLYKSYLIYCYVLYYHRLIYSNNTKVLIPKNFYFVGNR